MKFTGVDYFNIDSLLTTEEKMTRQLVRDLWKYSVKPSVVDAFTNEEPLDMKKLAPSMGELRHNRAFHPQRVWGGWFQLRDVRVNLPGSGRG